MFIKNTYRLRTVHHTLVVVLSLVALLSLTLASLYARTASAAPSTNLNFQARLKNSSGGIVPDGNYNIEFKIYNSSASAGSGQGSCAGDSTCLWTETRTGANVVRVANGYMTVNLGSVTAFPGTIQWGEQHWLSMRIGGTGGPSWDTEMNPRLQLTAVPFAFKADSANNVASANQSAASTNSSNVSIQSGSATGTTSNSGNISLDVGTATGTAGTISLGAANTSSLILGRSGLTTLNNGSLSVVQNLTVDTDSLFVDATNNSVGIGTTSQGTTKLYVTNGATAAAILSLRDNSTEVLGVADGGAVRLQNQTDSAAAFTIARAGSGGTLLNVDTSTVSGSRNGIISVGASDTSATLLVLDTKTDAGDPTGSDGAMYYNSNAGKLRCFENGAWADCVGIRNVPVTTAQNTISPTANSVVGLTVNGTSGTAATAISIVQAGAATALDVTSSSTGDGQGINLTNTTGVQASGLSITRSGAGGTTSSLLSLTQSGGTATNGILFSGTIGTDITSEAGRNISIITGTTGSITLDSGTTGPVNIGTSANAKTINIGSGSAVANNINIGGTGANIIGIGDSQIAGSVNIGGALTTGTIRIGGTGAQTGSIQLGIGTGSQAINLGTGGTGAKTVILGSTASSGTTTIQAGTGGVNIGTSTIIQNINLGTGGSGAKTVVLGSTATISTTTIQSGSGGIVIGGGVTTAPISIGTTNGVQTIDIGTGGTGAKTVTLGSTASTGATIIQSGTGNIALQAAGSATIAVVQVGDGGAGSATPDLFALDVKSTSGDPAGGIEGAMYYNTSDNRFRCYQGTGWVDCIGSGSSTGYTTVMDEASNLTQRQTINFTGSGVTCTDNAVNTRTDCTIGGSGGVTLISNDGVGSTSSSSGLEFDGSNVGLLQGCADGQTLKWDDTNSQWICGSDRATASTVLSGNYTNATTTFTDIDDDATGNSDIGFSVGANEVWIFEASLALISNVTADSKWQVIAPGASTCDISVSNVENAISVSNLGCGASTGNFAVSDTASNEYMVSGSIQTGANAGTVTVEFGQNTASGTSTITAGSYIVAYKVSGADVGEAYYSGDNRVRPGTLVSIDPRYEAGVTSSSGSNDSLLLGVISTKPGVVLGDNRPTGTVGRPVFLGLAGRVPTRVITENGAIVSGDYITSSSVPGVGMKARSGDRVVGRALSGYDGINEGMVMLFIDNDAGVDTLDTINIDAGGNVLTKLAAGARSAWNNTAGEAVAWITDTGEATFTKVSATAGSFKKLVFGEISVERDSGSAGEAVLETEMTELLIPSDKVKEDSLITLTLSSPSGNRQLYVKEKQAGTGFIVSFADLGEPIPATEQVTFNWLLINQE